MNQSLFQLPDTLLPFDDIIDGYFPLQVSLAQMMERLGAHYALVNLSHAPIMRIPGLPHDAPVPLNIRDGTAGTITRMLIEIDLRRGSHRLRGLGSWVWMEPNCTEDELDPMTRLAEPAFLFGLAHPLPSHRRQEIFPTNEDYSAHVRSALEYLGWPHASCPEKPTLNGPALDNHIHRIA